MSLKILCSPHYFLFDIQSIKICVWIIRSLIFQNSVQFCLKKNTRSIQVFFSFKGLVSCGLHCCVDVKFIYRQHSFMYFGETLRLSHARIVDHNEISMKTSQPITIFSNNSIRDHELQADLDIIQKSILVFVLLPRNNNCEIREHCKSQFQF